MRSPEEVFVKTPEEYNESKSKNRASEFLIREILSDLDAFPKDERNFIEKYVRNQTSCPDLKRYHKVIHDWWTEKYGSNFNVQASRNEILFKKYLPGGLEKIHRLQHELFQAVQAGDENKLAALKSEYEENYPDQLESVEALFGIRSLLMKQGEIDKRKKEKQEGLETKGDKESREEIMGKFRDLTEYQFLFTHFLIKHSEDRVLLEEFWDAAEQIAKRMNMSRELNMFRRGQISQVATYKIMEKIGHQPDLSHPDEDAFSAIDLWDDQDTAIQIKGANLEQPALLSVDGIYFPAIATDTAQSQALYNSYQMHELQKKNHIFHAKISQLGRRQNRKIEGFMMVIPYSKVDFITGEPDQAVVDFFAEKIGRRDLPNNE